MAKWLSSTIPHAHFTRPRPSEQVGLFYDTRFTLQNRYSTVRTPLAVHDSCRYADTPRWYGQSKIGFNFVLKRKSELFVLEVATLISFFCSHSTVRLSASFHSECNFRLYIVRERFEIQLILSSPFHAPNSIDILFCWSDRICSFDSNESESNWAFLQCHVH